MKMKKSFNVSIFYLIVASLFFLFGSCDDNGVTEPPSGIGNELIIDASSKTEWVYFSFSKGDTLTVDDPGNSLEWDLGLKRYRLKTNSGTSGPGQGGAVNIGKVDFDSVVEAPENGYTADDSLTYQAHGGSKTISTNQVLNGWAIMQGMPPTFIPTDSIYVVKTADGKYARLWFKSYYHPTESTSGYITLQYFYQPDGSRNLNE
jgi:hypothetical protein